MALEDAWVEELNGGDCGLETCNSGSDCNIFIVYCIPSSSTKYVRAQLTESV